MNKSWLTTPNYRLSRIIIGLIAAAAILWGVYCLIDLRSYEKHCTAAGQGTVTHNHSYSSKSGKHNIWTVEFTAADGNNYVFETGSTRTKASKGDRCAVLYDPENPAKAFTPEAPPDSGITSICSGIFIMIFAVFFIKKRT